MNPALREILLQQCRKKTEPTESQNEEEEWEEDAETFSNLEETESAEELPLEDVLAEKRRGYTAREEFIFLLYNDLLPFFIKEWNAEILRKKPETNNYNKVSNVHWKIRVPDESADITFISNNTYTGRVSRKMMEGTGVYRWANGARYKGDFERNCIHGKGLLEWNSDCWYEGDFANGHRHGRGLMVDGDNRYMYTGMWDMGRRHGKGYCRYNDNSSYDGDWVMDKMHGIGLRTYAGGSYYGRWRNGLRDGRGTMVWTNGNVYRGEWKCGAMHGYGEYVWNGFFNRSLTWPQEASYVGEWRNGMRHGKGELKLNTVGGAKYSGYWRDNKKHGYGVIIGSNGEKFESNPLFLNDVLCASNSSILEDKDDAECVRVAQKFVERPKELEKAPMTPILKPEQFPSLSYYVTRLLDPESLEERPLYSVHSGRCYSCENESCSCLATNSIDPKEQNNDAEQGADVSGPIINNSMKSAWEYEERWTHNCLILHMARLREIYTNYARLFTKSAPKCNLAMSRMCLWQLWRDCSIHKRGLSLIEIDNHIARNKSTFVKDPHHPFETIEIWQFLHALLEVSWQLYTKLDDTEMEEINGKLAGGLHKFLRNDVYPHAGDRTRSLCQEYQDLLPTYAVFKLCQQIGYPFSAKELLRAMCVSNDYGLLAFRELESSRLLEIMALICPAIKDGETDTIVNMDYELTFLEFYEVILTATKQLLAKRKLQTEELEADEATSQRKGSSTRTRRSLIKSKVRARISQRTSAVQISRAWVESANGAGISKPTVNDREKFLS